MKEIPVPGWRQGGETQLLSPDTIEESLTLLGRVNKPQWI